MKPNTLADISSLRRPQRALVVDDDKLMLAVLGDMLRDHGVGSVGTAPNGSAGIEAYDRMETPPELVVCDLNMPDGDGFQFMEKLAQRHYRGGVVLVSGMDDRTRNSAALMAKLHRLNVLATLHKPVDRTALGAALTKL